jgi:hypothetical protein
MAKVPKNNGKPWSQADISSLRTLAGGNTPIELIATKLGRTEESIRSKAINEGISMKPSTQSVNNNLRIDSGGLYRLAISKQINVRIKSEIRYL